MTEDTNHDKKYLRVEEVAELLTVNRSTVFSWINKGHLTPIRIGGVLRFDAEDISRALQDGKSRPVRNRRRKKILLIDDDELVLSSITHVLRENHYDVTAVTSGRKALEKVQESTFDLIVSDMRMPEMNGLETIRAIRRLQKELNRPKCAEILITAFQDKDPQTEATELGIPDCIFKPFDVEKFLLAVRVHIRRKEAVAY